MDGASARFCSQCGAALESGYKFCRGCGARVVALTAVAPTVAQEVSTVGDVTPPVVDWQMGQLTATPEGVVLTMETRAGFFGQKKGYLRQTFPYAAVSGVEVASRSDGTAVVLHFLDGSERGFQRCRPRAAVDALAAAAQAHGVSTEAVIAPSAAPAAPSRGQVRVKTYNNAHEYERDAQRMVRDGWGIEGQSQGRGRVRMGRTVAKAGVLLPWAVMRPSRKGDPLTVTWVR